jgi:hypothetical protein
MSANDNSVGAQDSLSRPWNHARRGGENRPSHAQGNDHNNQSGTLRDFGRWGAIQTVKINPSADPAVTGRFPVHFLYELFS